MKKHKQYVPRSRPDLGIRPGEQVIPHKHRDEAQPTTKELLEDADEPRD